MTAFEADQSKVTNPILHDETRVAPWNLPVFGGFSSDREMRFPDNTVNMKEAQVQGMTYTLSKQDNIIGYNPPTAVIDLQTDATIYVPCCGNQAGQVDMTKYRKWLKDNMDLVVQ